MMRFNRIIPINVPLFSHLGFRRHNSPYSRMQISNRFLAATNLLTDINQKLCHALISINCDVK